MRHGDTLEVTGVARVNRLYTYDLSGDIDTSDGDSDTVYSSGGSDSDE